MHTFQVSDLYQLAPEISLVLLALVVMVVDLFVKRRVVTVAVSLIGLVVPLAFVLAQAFSSQYNTPQTVFSGMFIVDRYALFFDVIFLIIASVLILASYSYIQKYVRAEGEFYALLLFSVTGMMFMASTNELISIYISLELTSIPLYVMAGLLRNSEHSAEAAVKYVLLGALSSAILLYGFALLYGLTGTTDLTAISDSIGKGVQNGNIMLLLAAGLVLAGFGFKISAVPFHMWAPDIYEGAPTPATAFFSVGSKAAGFAALMRVFMSGGIWQENLHAVVAIMAVVAVATMILGNVVAAVQSNVKRMMAYSSIAQAGYILVGFTANFAALGNNHGANGVDNSSVLFFILVYVLTNLGAFSGIIALANATGGEEISDFRGLAKRAPWLSACTALCMLSLAGIPPMAGFVSKVFIFTAAWSAGLGWLVVIALLTSVVSLVYYGRLVKSMYFDEPVKADHLSTPLGIGTSITVATAALLVVTFVASLILSITPAGIGLLTALK
jgi:NADH-quinone oxidoreductase subunit N